MKFVTMDLGRPDITKINKECPREVNLEKALLIIY